MQNKDESSGLMRDRRSEYSKDLNTQSQSQSHSWSSSISTIAEESAADGHDGSGRRTSGSSRRPSVAYSMPAMQPITSLEDAGYMKDTDSYRSWNRLPRIGESVRARKFSMNLVSHNVNGVSKQILYDSRYNPYFSKLDIFFSFNSQCKVGEVYTHAKSRLKSFVEFLELYHNSWRYASACYPFNVNINPNSKRGGYPSYIAGQNYEEIGEMIRLWFIQSLKFLLGKNSALFSDEIAQFLGRYSALYKPSNDEEPSPNDNQNFLQDAMRTTDILLIRCSMDQEFGWQLALDEPNWNVLDYLVDISPLNGKTEDVTLGTERNGLKSPNSESNSSISSSATPFSSEDSPNQDLDRGDPTEHLDKNTPSTFLNSEAFMNSDTFADIYASGRLEDCVGRDFRTLPARGSELAKAKGAFLEPSTNDSDEALSIKEKKSHKGFKGAPSSLSLSNLFRRKASHSDPPKSETKTRGVNTEDLDKSSLQIQNTYLEGYYASILANYRHIQLPTQFMFPKKCVKKLMASTPKGEHPSISQEYRRQYLQIRLPLKSESFPVVMCPDIWFNLAQNKWKGFLKELFRCIVPGGYLQTSTCNFGTVNACEDLEKTKREFPTTVELKALSDAVTLEAAKLGIQPFPMKYLVQLLKEVGFVNVKYSVVSLKRGDLSTEMGMVFEFFILHGFDFQLRTGFLDSSSCPSDCQPASFPLRYVNEHMGKCDENAGVSRYVLVTAQKPKRDKKPTKSA